MGKRHLKIIFLLILSITILSCGRDRPPKKIVSTNILTTEQPIEISKINFYFENSLSMNGYLDGEKFRQAMGKIIHKVEKDSFDSYFVNSTVYPTKDILNKIRKKQISTTGIGSSDHEFIFTNAIKNSNDNNLSIVVTDGIYSVSDGNIADVEVDIEDAFIDALKINEIETVVVKMSSNFKGRYYSESCPKKGGTKIDQERRYYILLFGNKDVINKALDEIVVIDDLEGFQEQARFFITKNLKVDYSVLTQGEEKKGKFKSINHSSIVRKIKDAEKFSQKGILLKDRFLQFGIAVDYSSLSIPDSYFLDTTNYSVEDNTGYKIIEIKEVEKLSKKSKSYEWIEKLNKKEKYNYSHLLVVKAKTKLYGDFKIDLGINFPAWIAETGTANDCNIINSDNTTFAFDRLMNGISKAYESVNTNKDFFKLEINIKP